MIETTRAEIMQTPAPSFITGLPVDADHSLGILGTLAMVVSALVHGILHFRRRASRDNTEMTKDRSESAMLHESAKEREAAYIERNAARESERRAWGEHNKLSVECATLRSDNAYQQREIQRLMQTVVELQQTLDVVKARLQHLANGATGHSGLGDLPG